MSDLHIELWRRRVPYGRKWAWAITRAKEAAPWIEQHARFRWTARLGIRRAIRRDKRR